MRKRSFSTRSWRNISKDAVSFDIPTNEKVTNDFFRQRTKKKRKIRLEQAKITISLRSGGMLRAKGDGTEEG